MVRGAGSSHWRRLVADVGVYLGNYRCGDLERVWRRRGSNCPRSDLLELLVGFHARQASVYGGVGVVGFLDVNTNRRL